MKRILILVLCLLASPLIVARGDEPTTRQRPAAKGKAAAVVDTPAGKVFVYKHSAGKPRELEIYFPPNHDPARSKVPGVILFHGGGWGGGSLSQFRTACHYLASRGVVAATADYRMLTKDESKALPAGETRKRVCITDAKSAIRWTKQHAAQLGIDPARIITGGGSAGGHISVLATTNPGLNDPADPPGIDTSVVAYLLFNPAFALDDKQDVEVDVLKHLPRSFPPAVVFFGTDDRWKEGWDVLHERLTHLGNPGISLQLAEGQKHSFFNNDPWQTVTLIAADRFLSEHGFLQGQPTLSAPKTGEKLVAAAVPTSKAPAGSTDRPKLAEPTNADEAAAQKAKQEAEIEAKYQALVQQLPADQQAWERILQENLGSFYLPIHKREKVAGKSNAWDFVADEPKLPRVLLIGDSVSRGYTQAVRKALAGKANVHRAPANCGPTASGLKNIDVWMGDSKWDLIHFNFGIHDRNTPVAEYAQRLEQLIERMQSRCTKLVWATTTPIPDTPDGKQTAASIVERNAVAAELMKKHHVDVDDLFAAVTPRLSELQNPNDVHFNAAGYEFLGEQVAASIQKSLELPAQPATSERNK